MKVYIVECGCYESQCISGVYASLEAAMKAFPVEREANLPTRSSSERPGGWQEFSEGRWSNGLDWDDCSLITEYHVMGEQGEHMTESVQEDINDQRFTLPWAGHLVSLRVQSVQEPIQVIGEKGEMETIHMAMTLFACGRCAYVCQSDRLHPSLDELVDHQHACEGVRT